MSSPSTSKTSRPCGCGGGSQVSTSKSGCGCGCGGSGDCQGGAYVRPRFFAGQLLTEEDLQALGEYVVSKNRLHNRHFFGEGVVCGFEVTCHPCGGGQVVVHPGHALDCCGNDIVLSCPQTLKVNDMVRDLRQRLLGGYDCGDPCVPDAAGRERREEKTERRHYCLYVRYCEDLTDPVSPYATDDLCGSGGCEPTRVREGLRFELRCREEAKPPEGMIDRVLACVGDPAQFQRQAGFVLSLDRIGRQATELRKLEQTAARDIAGLARAVEEAEAAVVTAEGDPTEERLREGVRRGAVLTRYLEQVNALPEERRAEVQGREELFQRIAKVRERVSNVVEPKVAEMVPNRLELAFYRAELTRMKAAAGVAAGSAEAPQKWTYELYPEIGETLCELRESLLDRLDASPDLARCELRHRVRAIDIPCPPGRDVLDGAEWLEPSRQLKEAWLSYWQDCICRALLPPCPPCDDPGVLLACLEVEDCEVVKICNLERTFVLTPAALRYWLPLHWLGDLLERLCCTDLRLEQPREPIPVDSVFLRDRILPIRTSLFAADLPRLGRAASALSSLVEENDVPLLSSALSAVRAFTARPVAAPAARQPAPAAAPVAEAVEERLALAAVRKLERSQKKSAEDLKNLQRELQKQVDRNAELERRLKALEEARPS